MLDILLKINRVNSYRRKYGYIAVKVEFVKQSRKMENFNDDILDHLSRKLIGELIVYQCSGGRLSSIRPRSTMLKHLRKDF